MTASAQHAVRDTVAQLLQHLHRGGAFAYWWTLPNRRSIWWPAGQPTPMPNGRSNVYFGVHPTVAIPPTNARGEVRPPEEVRGQNAYIAALNCLFGEFDAKSFGGDKAAAYAHVDRLSPVPSVVIDSGGGYHAYWLLRDPFLITDDVARERARQAQATWVCYVGGDDGAKDLARVLRVPGSHNYKYPDEPLVQIVTADFSRLYAFADLERLAVAGTTASGAAVVDDDDLFAVAMDTSGANPGAFWLSQALARARPGTRNAIGFWLACQLRDHGVSEQDAEQYMRTYQAHVPPVLNDPYLLSEALASLQQAYRQKSRGPAQSTARGTTATNGSGGAPPAGTPPSTNGTAPPAAAVSSPFHCTDLGNAQRLIYHFGHDLRYVPAWGRWLIWDGTRWAKDEIGLIYQRAREVVSSIYAEAAAHPDQTWRQILGKWAARSEERARLTAMVALAETEPGIALYHTELDTDSYLLNCLNGTIDLRTGTLRPHQRSDLLTKRIAVAYDPAATCPRWLTFLQRVFAGDADLIRYVQRAVGYTLSGDVSEDVLLFAYGTGGNGKSTFFTVLMELLGEYAQKIPTTTLMIKQHGDRVAHDIAQLVGIRLSVASEIGRGQHLDEALVKDLTGGDKRRGRFLYQNSFDYTPTDKLWMFGNYKPVIRGSDDGIWRRVKLIPFSVKIPEQERDPHFEEQLLAELPGILVWAIEGCREWRRSGIGSCAAVDAATESYKDEMDILSAFIAECCVVGRRHQVGATELYNAYKLWCVDNGESFVKQTLFGTMLTERGYSRRQDGNGRSVRLGIDLKQKTP